MLVGRDGDLACLAESLEDRHPVVVVGEAGVGKTTLLRASATATGRTVFEGGALSTLSWMEHLALRRALGRPLGAGDAIAVAAEVERVVGAGVLILDDLQWADAATLEAVALLVGRLNLLAGVRRGDPGAGPALDRLREAGFKELDLDPLDAARSAEVVGILRPDLGPAAVERLVHRTGGNPLLLHELTATGEPSPSLRLALAARLRLLDLPGHEAFNFMALAGRPLDVDDVGAVGVKSLLNADLAVLGPGGVTVRHALLAEVATDLLGPLDRCRLHARLARTVGDPGEAARHHALAGENDLACASALRAAGMAERPGERASHLAVAAACASGPEADALRLRAARALDDALDWAGVVASLDLITGEDTDTRAWAALLRARAAYCGGNLEVLRTALADGLALVAGSGTEVEVRLMIERSRLPIFVDCDWDEGIRSASVALDLARSTGIEQPRAEYILGTALGGAGAPGWEDHLEAARAGAREAADIQTEFTAANNLISLHEAAGSPARARAVGLEMIDRARDLNLGYWERCLRGLMVNLDLHAGAYHQVVADAEALLAVPLDARTRDVVVEALCFALVDLGRLDEAVRRAEVARGDAVPDYRGRSQFALVMAEAALWGGQPLRALELADAFLLEGIEGDRNRLLGAVTRAWACFDLGRDPTVQIEPPAWPILLAVPEEVAGLVLLWSGENHSAADRFDAAAGIWQPYHRRGELRCAWAAGEALLRVGDVVGARGRLEAVEARAEALGMEPLLARVRRSLRAAGQRRSAPRTVGDDGLTGRQRQVLALVAEGFTDRAIASRLGVSPRTVAAQVASATAKLGARSRGHAAALASRT